MRKLCLFAVMAIVLASLGLAGPALAGPHDTYSWFFEDGFDTYTAGELEAGSGIPPVWTTPSAPLGEFVLNTTDTPFNAPNSLRVTTINSDGAAMDATRLIPSAFTIPSGRLLYLHCRIKASGGTRDQNNYSIKLTSGNNAWYGFGVWEATETSIRARVGNSVSGYVPIGSGWRELDIVFDPSIGTKGKSTWYLDGVWFHDLLFSTVGTGAQPDNVFTGIQISDHNYLNAQNGYVMYDDIKAGTDATTLAPVILSPEANCSGQDTYYTFDNLGAELDPTVTWAVDPHTEYQVKVFNVSPNDPNGTTGQVYDSGQLVSGADSHTLTGSTLAEDVTYWLRVRVKINDAWQPWSAAGVDFRVRNLIFDSPDTPVFIAPSPANDGYQRSLSVLPTFAWEVPVIVPASDPHQSAWLRVGTTEGGSEYYDSGWFYGADSKYLGSIDITPPLGNLIEGQIYYATVRVRNGCIEEGDSFAPDPVIRFLATEAPISRSITEPINGVLLSSQPVTIKWSSDTPPSGQEVTGYTVVVCDLNDTSPLGGGGVVWGTASGSGDPGSTGVTVSGLPLNTHLWAFVRLQNAFGYGPWSMDNADTDNYPSYGDTKGFYIYSGAAPDAPSITSPSSATGNRKPLVAWASSAGQLADKFEVKITSGPTVGSTTVWTSGEVSIPAASIGGAPCTTLLTDGSTYYAWARIHNPTDWSLWSSGLAFTVDNTIAKLDVRHMDEATLTTTSDIDAPNDMFGDRIDEFGRDDRAQHGAMQVLQATLTACDETNGVLRIEDFGHNRESQEMRLHKIAGLSLDQGVTLITAVSIVQDALWFENGGIPIWERCQILICDAIDDSLGDRAVATFRVGADDFAITTSAFDNSGVVSVPRTDDASKFTVIRITGRNAIYGDPESCVWKLYANEQLVATATGTISEYTENLDTGGLYEWVDMVAIGQGEAYHEAELRYDYLAVNASGDYAPGEWDYALDVYVPAGGTADWLGNYTSISAAKSAPETAIANIDLSALPAVITRVDDITGAQTGYYVQGAASGIRVNTTNTQGALVAPGREVTALKGVVPWPVKVNFTITDGYYSIPIMREMESPVATLNPVPTTPVAPIGMAVSQLMLGGGSCIDQVSGDYADNTGMLVRIFGSLVYHEYQADPEGYVMWIDDGSGVLDGRGGSTTLGVRVFADLGIYPLMTEPMDGTFWMIEGISSYETVPVPPGGTYPNVRQILLPSFTKLL